MRLEKKSPAEKKVFLWAGLTGAVVLALDMLTKLWVVRNFELYVPRDVIAGFFSFTYARNKGAAWSILEGKVWLLLLIALVIGGLLVWNFRSLCEGCRERYFALMMILGGTLGNSYDRCFRGAVVDFIHVHYYNVWHYPIFNVADIAICCGCFLFVLSCLFRKKTAAGKD